VESLELPLVQSLQLPQLTSLSEISLSPVSHHTKMLSTISLNLSQKRHPCIWGSGRLAHDCKHLVPLPAPVGGVVVVSSTAIMYRNHGQVCVCVAVARCCRVLQDVAKCCRVLRRVVDGWHVPQALAGVCVLQGVAVLPVVAVCRQRQLWTAIIGSVAVCHRVLQGVAGCCKVCVARCRRQQWYANHAQEYAGMCRNQ